MRKRHSLIAALATTLLFVSVAGAQREEPSQESLERLSTASGGSARVLLDPATGVARMVTFAAGQMSLRAGDGASPEQKAEAFFNEHGEVFGVRSAAAELVLGENRQDALGQRHLLYSQEYERVPVFGSFLRVHFDQDERMTGINGRFLPDLELDPSPRRTSEEAAEVALAWVDEDGLEVRSTELLVYRPGALKGTHNLQVRNHLVWAVEVANDNGVREHVYVDAHYGKVVDQITGVHEVIDRRMHQMTFGNVIWQEGDPLPYDEGGSDDAEIDGIIDATKHSYDFFSNLSGGEYLSYDGDDIRMHAVFDHEDIECPNANWNGQSTNYCSGTGSDDVVAHEWTHAYTGETHDLIYQDQPGALNEAYSDIFGELVDQLNGQGQDSPSGRRPVGECSTLAGTARPTCTVHSPAGLAGNLLSAGAAFNPDAPLTVRADVELVNDGTDTQEDGCQPLDGFTAGRIALVQRGNCNFVNKLANADDAGAAGMIVMNNESGLFTMGGDRQGFTIPSIMITEVDGERIRNALESTNVNVTIHLPEASSDTVKWLIGEDASGFGGAIRDMWAPNCLNDPDRVTDTLYHCADSDNGGVHINSGIPNHAFTLLIDGGTFNGVRVNSIGSTRAAHIYWRAMRVYQGPSTGFLGHADALEQSCEDLIGVNLTDLETGNPSGTRINRTHCDHVARAIDAVELRSDPEICGFQTLLDPDPPRLFCEDPIFEEDFESDPSGDWTLSNEGVYSEYSPRDWEWTDDVPSGGTGSAFFGINSRALGDCFPGSDDQSGVMRLTSPVMTMPDEFFTPPIFTFDHWVATEENWDGGNLKISVNGSGFDTIIAAEHFTFNAYNGSLAPDSVSDNPLAGQRAFNGHDEGTFSGSWGQSRIDLSNYVEPGDRVRVRFDLGVDGCNGNRGWYVDNVRICGTTEASLPKSDLIFADGFESGDTSEWDKRLNPLGNPSDVTESAGLVGDFGYLIEPRGQVGRPHVQTQTPDGDYEVRTQLFVRGNNLRFKDGVRNNKITVLARLNGGARRNSKIRWQLEMKKIAGEPDPQLWIRVWEQGGKKRNIALDRSVNLRSNIRVNWKAASSSSANNGELEVRVNGRKRVDLSDLDNYLKAESFAVGMFKFSQRIAAAGELNLDQVTLRRRK